MRLAIEKARQGIAKGQSPFGCAIARGDEILAVEHNVVWATTDITAHAEVTALRAACAKTKQVVLPGTIAASTCEPCPMCMAALLWARVETVYFGATIADAQAAGFNEIPLPAAEIVRRAGGRLKLVGGVLGEECTSLFAQWQNAPSRRPY